MQSRDVSLLAGLLAVLYRFRSGLSGLWGHCGYKSAGCVTVVLGGTRVFARVSEKIWIFRFFEGVLSLEIGHRVGVPCVTLLIVIYLLL